MNGEAKRPPVEGDLVERAFEAGWRARHKASIDDEAPCYWPEALLRYRATLASCRECNILETTQETCPRHGHSHTVDTTVGGEDVVERAVSQAIRSALGLKGQQITDMGLDDRIDAAARAAIAAIAAIAAHQPEGDRTAICDACDGSGFGVADTYCGKCGGSGGIPLAALSTAQPVTGDEGLREALKHFVSQAEAWLGTRERYARPGWMQPAINKARTALAKGEGE